eukprot:455635_1
MSTFLCTIIYHSLFYTSILSIILYFLCAIILIIHETSVSIIRYFQMHRFADFERVVTAPPWIYIAYEREDLYEPQTMCTICQHEFDPLIPQSILSCGHKFCRDCINELEGHRYLDNKDNNWDRYTFCNRGNSYCWSECPLCNTPYHILKNKFDYNYNFNRCFLKPTYCCKFDYPRL